MPANDLQALEAELDDILDNFGHQVLHEAGSRRRLNAMAQQAILSKVRAYGEASVSVSFVESGAGEWKEKVYLPEIVNGGKRLYKKPGYRM